MIDLVLLHAFPLSHRMWQADAGVLKPYARVFAPDLPGFGGTARQPTPSIPKMASLVAESLIRSGVKKPAMIAGLSMGGYVAFEFFRQFPERVCAMGLFSTRAALDTPEAKAARFETADRIRKNGLDSLSKAVLPKLLGKTTLLSNSALPKQVTQMIIDNDRNGVADSLLAMANRRDSTELLARMNVPALVIAGDEDSFIPVDESRKMSQQIAKASLEVIPHAGHLVNLEQPQQFQQALIRFLKQF